MFSLKTIIYGILSSEMLRENHAVLGGGGDIDFRRGGGGVNIRFRTKYRHMMNFYLCYSTGEW
jgi:hypothetical protein